MYINISINKDEDGNAIQELVPLKNNFTDAGYDLKTASEINLYPQHEVKVDTGIRMEIPVGYMGLVVPRSGLGSKGLVMKNTVGIIDADYRGNIFVKIKNTGDELINIPQFGRFAQIVFVPILLLSGFNVFDDLNETHRGSSGFGDSGL